MRKLIIIHLLAMTCNFVKPTAALLMEIKEELLAHKDPAITRLVRILPTGLLYTEDLSNFANILPTATAKNVTMYFYSTSNRDVPIPINAANTKSLITNTKFDTSKESLFIISGWSSNYTSPINILIFKSVLEKYDVNVFIVDWSSFANQNYVTAFVNVPIIGQIVGTFIKNISEAHNYPLNRIKIVGHSLGAHIAGVAGKVTNGALQLIQSLDAAGPLFTIANTANRLCKNDAQFVQAIHTNGNLLGFYPTLGHSDYYPNGGLSQPGCDFDISGMCSHSRAYEYYAESISTGGFTATQCNSYYASYQHGFCRGNVESEMGGYNPDTKVRGKFYLNTKSSPPYAEGK